MSKELDYRVEINGKSSRPASYKTVALIKGLKSNCKRRLTRLHKGRLLFIADTATRIHVFSYLLC